MTGRSALEARARSICATSRGHAGALDFRQQRCRRSILLERGKTTTGQIFRSAVTDQRRDHAPEFRDHLPFVEGPLRIAGNMG